MARIATIRIRPSPRHEATRLLPPSTIRPRRSGKPARTHRGPIAIRVRKCRTSIAAASTTATTVRRARATALPPRLGRRQPRPSSPPRPSHVSIVEIPPAIARARAWNARSRVPNTVKPVRMSPRAQKRPGNVQTSRAPRTRLRRASRRRPRNAPSRRRSGRVRRHGLRMRITCDAKTPSAAAGPTASSVHRARSTPTDSGRPRLGRDDVNHASRCCPCSSSRSLIWSMIAASFLPVAVSEYSTRRIFPGNSARVISS